MDQLPRILWPKLQIAFFILSVAMLLISLLGVAYAVAGALGLIPHK